jgi:hypothetical protein
MGVGFVLVRIVYTPIEQVHVIGFLVGLGILMWGMGAISIALYDRVQPRVATSAAVGPMPPVALPPHTSVGGVQPA